MAKKKIHEYAKLFPPMPEDQYEVLKQDIKANGLLHPIMLTKDGQILDGVHRYRACKELKIPIKFTETKAPEDALLGLVVSLNMKRRHLDESQRAMIAAKIATMPKGNPNPNSPIGLLTQAQAAIQLNVGVTSLKRAKQVLEKGVEALQDAVMVGQIAVDGADAVAKLEPKQQQAVVTRVLDGAARNAKDAVRQLREEKQIKEIEKAKKTPTKGEHNVIVVDPPWRYEKRREDTTQRGKVKYPDMSELEIAAIKIPAAKDAVLWLWVTNAHLVTGEASRVLYAWGFEPKTLLTWHKNKMGVGDWLRGQTEHCILAVKGNYKMKKPIPPTIFEAAVPKEHSRKPDEFYELVDKCCPGSKCELFARVKRKGWEQAGAELGSVK